MPEQALQQLVPIFGAGYVILPEVALFGKNLFEANIYAQEHDLEVLPLGNVCRTAKAVKSRSLSKEFAVYARKLSTKIHKRLEDGVINEAYRKLHDQIWEKPYSIRAKEVLILSRTTLLPNVVVGRKAVQLLRDYRVTEDEKFDVDEIENPIVEVQWPMTGGTMPSELEKIFELRGVNSITYVDCHNKGRVRGGPRALDINFNGHFSPNILFNSNPMDEIYFGGYLLGRRIEGEEPEE